MIRIVNWRRYQGYTRRGPTWIKLHCSLHRDPQWVGATLQAKALLPALWIICAESGDPKNGTMTDEPEVISKLSSISQNDTMVGLEDLKARGFIDNDTSIADDATFVSRRGRKTPATEAEAEVEKEREIKGEAEVVAGEDDSVFGTTDPPGIYVDLKQTQTKGPEQIGIFCRKSSFCQQDLAHMLYRLAQKQSSPAAFARVVLREASRTPTGRTIDGLDLSNVPDAWAKVTTEALIRIAKAKFGVDLEQEGMPRG